MNSVRYTKWLLIFCLLTNGAWAATPGAFEAFPAEDHADTWTVYDFSDGGLFFPQWDGGGTNPFMFFNHTDDHGLWFFTDSQGAGDWLGDYEAAEIQAISTEFFISDLSEFSFIDCVVFTDGPAGNRYYFSESFFAEDFSEDGWWLVSFPLETDWFYLDDNDEFQSVEMEAADFQVVDEIGFRILPAIGTADGLIAAIDGVSLDPLVRAPELAVGHDEGFFNLEFTPPQGNECVVERLILEPEMSWEEVAGQTGIHGSDPHVFTTATTESSGIFRVVSEARFEQVDLP